MDKALNFSRFSIFVVYFWFGILKVVGESPANTMVLSLLEKTVPFMEPGLFLIIFGLFEVLIGVLILIPSTERIALWLIGIHMVTVFMPMVLLPSLTWQGTLIPTMEGQYIIKNILIIALVFNLVSKKVS